MSTTRTPTDRQRCSMLRGLGSWKCVSYWPSITAMSCTRIRAGSRRHILLRCKATGILWSIWGSLSMRPKGLKRRSRQRIRVWMRRRRKSSLWGMSTRWLFVMSTARWLSSLPSNWYSFQKQTSSTRAYSKCYATHNWPRAKPRTCHRRNSKKLRLRS